MLIVLFLPVACRKKHRMRATSVVHTQTAKRFAHDYISVNVKWFRVRIIITYWLNEEAARKNFQLNLTQFSSFFFFMFDRKRSRVPVCENELLERLWWDHRLRPNRLRICIIECNYRMHCIVRPDCRKIIIIDSDCSLRNAWFSYLHFDGSMGDWATRPWEQYGKWAPLVGEPVWCVPWLNTNPNSSCFCYVRIS